MEKIKSRKLRNHCQEAADSFKEVSDERKVENNNNWDEIFEELRKFASDKGHISVTTHRNNNGDQKLGRWLNRSSSDKKIMSNDQRREFKEFTNRFEVNMFDFQWENMFIEVKQDFKTHQSFTVKKNTTMPN